MALLKALCLSNFGIFQWNGGIFKFDGFFFQLNFAHFVHALRLFKALCLFFLPNFPCPTFIPYSGRMSQNIGPTKDWLQTCWCVLWASLLKPLPYTLCAPYYGLLEQIKSSQAQFVPRTPHHYCVLSSSKTQTKSLRRRFQVLELVTPMTNCYRFSARPTNRRQYPVTPDSAQNSKRCHFNEDFTTKTFPFALQWNSKESLPPKKLLCWVCISASVGQAGKQ